MTSELSVSHAAFSPLCFTPEDELEVERLSIFSLKTLALMILFGLLSFQKALLCSSNASSSVQWCFKCGCTVLPFGPQCNLDLACTMSLSRLRRDPTLEKAAAVGFVLQFLSWFCFFFVLRSISYKNCSDILRVTRT